MAFGSSGLRFTSSRLVSDKVAALGAETETEFAIEGQLSFVVPPGATVKAGNYVCSATVQTPGIITTAGHCTEDGNGHAYKNWLFVPVTRSGSAPFGKWAYRTVFPSPTWASGGGTVPNDQDVAVIVFRKDKSGHRLGDYTGTAGFNIPDLYSGQQVTVLGYPCNIDNCAKDHRTDAQAAGGSGNTDIIGADAGGGSSGGGWIVNYGVFGKGQPASGVSDDGQNELVAVTSYGPTTGVGYLGASILDNRYIQCTPLKTCAGGHASAILNIACQDYPGAC
ncbi:MAG: hypothetical protein WA005_06470 [Candidatus Binataceae bacterium]